MTGRSRSVLLWTAATVLTLVLAVFQRMSGPTYPLRTQVELTGSSVALTLPRTHAGDGGLTITVPATGGLQGTVQWRRYPTEDSWADLALTPSDGKLQAELPHLPAAAKVEYRLRLAAAGTTVMIPAGEPVIARYRGSVSAAILIPHIIAMFLAMLLATRAMLDRLLAPQERRIQVLLVMVLLLLGGALLGPLVQLQAFGALWTGWPLGGDLTDNKTVVAILAWLPATVLALRRRPTRWLVVAGWVVMMAVFLIPHSLRGSQHDWDQPAPVSGQQTPGSPP